MIRFSLPVSLMLVGALAVTVQADPVIDPFTGPASYQMLVTPDEGSTGYQDLKPLIDNPIRVTSFNVSLANIVGIGFFTGGGGAGKASFDPVSVQTPLDSASVLLMSILPPSEHLKKVDLLVQRTLASNHKVKTVADYTMYFAIIQSVQLDAGGDTASLPTVNYQFQYGGFAYTYNNWGSSGKLLGTLTTNWDRTTNSDDNTRLGGGQGTTWSGDVGQARWLLYSSLTPEPTSAALLLMGVAGMVIRRRQRA